MLRIVEGGFASIAYSEIKEDIRKAAEANKRVYLIVPEQQSVMAEKEIMAELDPSSALYFEVTNFTRLANTVYRSLGGIAAEYSDKGKEALIMWRTLTELSPFISLTGGAEVNTGMVEKALAAVGEMKSIGAVPDELMALSERRVLDSNLRLRTKLTDISRIMALYKKLLNEKYTSAGDECERLSAKLAENPDFFAGACFYLSGFTSFTEPQYRVLSELMRTAEVTVHLTVSRVDYESFEYTELVRTKERLLRAADKVGCEKYILRREAISGARDPLLIEAGSLLWRSFGEIDNNSLQNTASLRIFEARDPYEECDFVASDIKRKIMAGAAYRDIAIVARDVKKYLGILDTSLTNADIPHFISQKKDIASFEAVKLIYTAFSAVESGFAREDVVSYAKCKLSGIDAEACDDFELYTETWGITKERLTDGIAWNMNPNGYGKAPKNSGKILLGLADTRERLIDPLKKFSENLAEAKTVKEHATALVLFLTDISLEDRICDQVALLRELGESDAADENGRLWQIVCDALDSLVEVLGDTEINTTGFLSQLKVVLSEADIGRIPAFYDEVTVGSADMIRLSEKKEVYLIGVNAGEFPRSAAGSAYFTERDREMLAALGLATDEDGDIPYARELFFFSRAFSAATDGVTLSYSTRNEALTAVHRADVIDRIMKITGEKVRPIAISEMSEAERIYFPAVAMEFVGKEDVRRALCDSGYVREIEIAEKKIENADKSLTHVAADEIYPGDIALTQTRIEAYIDCPFAYYLKYNLRISENERAEFDARNIGTFMHAILENFFSDLRGRGISAGDTDEDTRRELVMAAAKEYLDGVIDEKSSSKRTSLLLDRLCRAALPVVDGLCDELRGCDFSPEFFELKIDRDDPALPDPAEFTDKDGKRAYIYGSIDRVDTYSSEGDVYVRVIDYKTGAKSFSPTDLDEGRNLQMFLYLKAIVDTDNESFKNKLGVKDGGRIIPAGVIYVKTDMSDVTVSSDDPDAERSAIAKNQARRGMILNEPESIEAMNKAYLPVKFTKNGAPDARYEKYLYTREGWNELGEKISAKIGEIQDRMRSGDITLAKKKDSHCESCKFKPICRRPD